jgi:CheY-like chemotaxis protein
LRRSLQLRLLNKIGVKYELAENGKIAVDYVLKTIEENAAGIEALADAEAAADAEEDEADLAAEAAAADRAAEQLAPSRRLSAASHSSSTTARGEHFEMGPLRKRAHDLAFELVSVDLVIMDNQMPVMTGEQATRALRSAGYRGVIIGMTGDPTGSADRSEFEAAGLNRCLDKDSKAIEILHGIVRSFAIGGDNYETVSADTRGGSRNTRWIAQAEALAEIDAQQLAEAMGVPRVVCNDTAGVHSRRGSYVPGRRGSLSAARSPFPQLASTAPPPCAAPPPPPPPPPPHPPVDAGARAARRRHAAPDLHAQRALVVDAHADRDGGGKRD